MTIKHEGLVDIAIGYSATSKIWKNKTVAWSWMVEKLQNAIRTGETLEQYKAASKDERTSIKDVGGYFGGKLKNGQRHPENVISRHILYLDVDFANKTFWDNFAMLYACSAVLHSTHSHTVEKPKYRLIIPLSRAAEPDEYEAVARRLASDLNMELIDSTTFQKNRFMFWPSVSDDAEYEFHFQDGEWLNVDTVLAMYEDWHDSTSWPRHATDNEVMRTNISRQEDPLAKNGIVGTFCREYTVQDAINTFLSDLYVESINGRYTYVHGTTGGGLLVYDDKFSYSYHNTDPSNGRLCNAFDLVRIHKYGHLDKATPKDKPDAALRSYRAMEDFATKDNRTKVRIANEKLSEARFEFENPDVNTNEVDLSWTSELEANAKGVYENSANNINTILKHDQFIKKAFNLNIFDNKRYVIKDLPWRAIPSSEPLRDVDYSGLRNYIESVYGIVGSSKIDDSLALELERNSYHPVREYLKSLTWDGISRIETLLIDYFGADDTLYTRAAMKKTLVGGVARVFEPGVKFDLVLTLVGDQRTFKSTFVKLLGKNWFSDTFITVQGKEAFEQIQGAWIIEIAELSGLRKAEVETIKHFLSKSEDMFRPAYGRTVETYRRQCIFIGTTNNENFLRDPTGNRRFLPIDVHTNRVTKSVRDDFAAEVDQVWAEAYVLYKAGEKLYMSPDEEQLATKEQKRHSEVDERRGVIEGYLDTLLPEDWSTYDLDKRKAWLTDDIGAKGKNERVFVCIAEIWCECLGNDKSEMSRYNTRDINDVMKSLHDWEFVNSTKNFSIYGTQKYYARKID